MAGPAATLGNGHADCALLGVAWAQTCGQRHSGSVGRGCSHSGVTCHRDSGERADAKPHTPAKPGGVSLALMEALLVS